MITDDVVGQLAAVVKSLAVDRVFVLVDENTVECCLPILRYERRDVECDILDRAKIIKIKAGDQSKPIETAVEVCNELVDN